MTITAVAKSFLNLVYPLRCASCNKDIEALNNFGICDLCLRQIPENSNPPIKGLHFEKAYSACLYEGVLKELIHKFKYKNKVSLSKILSKLMIDFIKYNPEALAEIEIITFVPLHDARERERGFNQSGILAAKLSKESGIRFSDTLKKTIATRHQNELSRNDRLINLKGAFKIRDGAMIEGLNVLLVDDVITTGATLDECAKTLLDNGAKKVNCFTLARGI